ncbi:Rne/Rng family ribonuclease [Nanchangia anserum]|uniref:Ribonuclease E n=2 Tax=Nanchangia anserum TaxID=2692125 RepID=A0A8I0G959_9ACTO|nr:Rne/Rng family ribonuclease [Nanchangia anserum]MBD3690197.1 Rne/Rng family ribonuclease [Nanchangia anserum]QOX82586.1 Rne/Rng family ribonuclease [Nanchangia anserum]
MAAPQPRRSRDDDGDDSRDRDDSSTSRRGKDGADKERKQKKGGAKKSGGKKDSAKKSGEKKSEKNSAPADDEAPQTNDDAGSERGDDDKPKSRKRTRSRKDRGKDKDAPSDASDESAESGEQAATDGEDDSESESHRRRRRRSRRSSDSTPSDEITALKGSTRLEAKRRRRREGRRESHRHHAITESEFLARRESVDRRMLIRERDGLNQIAVTEDGLLVEHYVARHTQTTMVGSVYLGKVQNVLPSMEAAFIDLGKGRNAVLYAGEVNWDAAGLSGHPRRIEQALSPGDTVLVQVTKDPIGHKGARLTAQVTLAGRYLVLVPDGAMTGISRKLPETERKRLKKLLKTIVPADHGVIIRTAAEGATKEQLAADVERLLGQWEAICAKQKSTQKAPQLLHGEPELALRVVRDVFNEDFNQLIIEGKETWASVSAYVNEYAPDLADRMERWVENDDLFAANRVDEQLAKGMDRKVWLPSGGHLVIDRTEAMTVVDVNTGKYTGGADGTLEETVTKNNLEAAEEIVRQLRLRDIGGIIVIDFVDMVLPANRDLVLRRLIECLGRDRTRHQVTEVTSLGLVQMTRKRVGQGLVEAFSTPCAHCEGRGFIVHDEPVEKPGAQASPKRSKRSGKREDKNAVEDAKAKAQKQAARSMSKIAEASKHDSGDSGRTATKASQAPVENPENADASARTPATTETPRGAKRAAGAATRTSAATSSSVEAVIISDLDDLKAERAAAPKRERKSAPATPDIELGEGPREARQTPRASTRKASTRQAPSCSSSDSAALIIDG